MYKSGIGKENGSCKIGADEDRFASSAIHERTDDQAQEKIWQPSGRVHRPDIHCSAVQRQQYENLQERGRGMRAKPDRVRPTRTRK
jgi:hypothetical protein